MMGVLQFFANPCSALFSVAIRLRHKFYDWKFLPQKRAPLPVISIGNLVAGGAGKTQVALLLAELLSPSLRVALLSRGYLSLAEHAKNPLVVDVAHHSAAQCGDEPWLLASRLPAASIIVNKNRLKSAQVAKNLGAQLVLLDDGMQHRKLCRDVEIVVIDGTTPFGSYLPKGKLREDPRRLNAAHLILFIGNPETSIKKEVAALSSAPQVVAKIAAQGVFDLEGSPFPSLQGKRVALFCGIGNPLRFVQSVRELGVDIVDTHFSSDHTVMTHQKLYIFALDAKKMGATCLVCTEKDKVKLSSKELPLPIVWVKATLEIVDNGSAWLEMVNTIKELGNRA